jgi:hypothetical protein
MHGAHAERREKEEWVDDERDYYFCWDIQRNKEKSNATPSTTTSDFFTSVPVAILYKHMLLLALP